jgi:hypothetical protein
MHRTNSLLGYVSPSEAHTSPPKYRLSLKGEQSSNRKSSSFSQNAFVLIVVSAKPEKEKKKKTSEHLSTDVKSDYDLF